MLEKNDVPGAVAGLVIGGKDIGEAVVESQDVDMGKHKSKLQEAPLNACRQYPSRGASLLADK